MMKRIAAVFLGLAMVFCLYGCGNSERETAYTKLSGFYDAVSDSQELLDSVADDIYSNWHGAIYNDEFNEDINRAIAAALVDHEDDLDEIEELDEKIAELFSEVKRDEEHGELVKEIMSAYSDYYELVVNVSGSFNSFSAEKETLKKELASSLKELSYEL